MLGIVVLLCVHCHQENLSKTFMNVNLLFKIKCKMKKVMSFWRVRGDPLWCARWDYVCAVVLGMWTALVRDIMAVTLQRIWDGGSVVSLLRWAVWRILGKSYRIQKIGDQATTNECYAHVPSTEKCIDIHKVGVRVHFFKTWTMHFKWPMHMVSITNRNKQRITFFFF